MLFVFGLIQKTGQHSTVQLFEHNKIALNYDSQHFWGRISHNKQVVQELKKSQTQFRKKRSQNKSESKTLRWMDLRRGSFRDHGSAAWWISYLASVESGLAAIFSRMLLAISSEY
jgi:hypothetical protein